MSHPIMIWVVTVCRPSPLTVRHDYHHVPFRLGRHHVGDTYKGGRVVAIAATEEVARAQVRAGGAA